MKLRLSQTAYGQGVFAEQPIAAGTEILNFTGEIINFSTFLDSNFTNDEDHIIQVGLSAFMAPSGGLDDFVNHSCDPNCWLRITNESEVMLVALLLIPAGEELSFDYSLTSFRDPFPWSMPCSCGAATCRRQISNFELQPQEWQQRQLARGIVPRYIRDHLSQP